MQTDKLSEEIANEMVFKALNNIGIDDIRSFKRDEYYKDVDSITYTLTYNKKYNETIMMKITMGQYYDLLRNGLYLSGYNIHKIKRKIIDGLFTYYITYEKDLDIVESKKM